MTNHETTTNYSLHLDRAYSFAKAKYFDNADSVFACYLGTSHGCRACASVWHAAVWSGSWEKLLTSAMGALPPINLAVASWTDYLARACEFNYAYMISPGINMPFTPSPPFGEVALDNTNLDIRAHLLHHHEPRWHRTYWILGQEEELLVQTSTLTQRPLVHLSLMARVTRTDTITLDQLDADANDASEYATSNLFMWYRQNEGGLWLADALEDVGMTRRKNRHPWITYEADEELSCEDTEDLKDIDVDGIIRWRDAISSPSPPASINSHRNILTTSQGHPHESTDRQSG